MLAQAEEDRKIREEEEAEARAAEELLRETERRNEQWKSRASERKKGGRGKKGEEEAPPSPMDIVDVRSFSVSSFRYLSLPLCFSWYVFICVIDTCVTGS